MSHHFWTAEANSRLAETVQNTNLIKYQCGSPQGAVLNLPFHVGKTSIAFMPYFSSLVRIEYVLIIFDVKR
jgi:hypothetical protein